MELKIEKEIVYLIKHKPFYAHFIQQMNRVITDKVDTLGVNITDRINLYINPKFFGGLNLKERVACLEHETLHILNKHILRGGDKQAGIFNIATDIAINQYIENLPKGALSHNQFKFPPEKDSEFYYKKLLKNARKVEIGICSGEGKGSKKEKGKTLDDHDLWKKGNANREYQHEIIKRAIKNTIEKTKDYGSLPSSIQTEIRNALRYRTLNWKSLLHRFVYKATLVNFTPTRKRPNRRYEMMEGNRVECKLDLLVGLDTSGSIDDKTLSEFFSEIEKIKSLGMKITVAECDAQVHKVYSYKKLPKYVSGRGGTDFRPVFELAKKLKPNCIIYLTDGYGEYPERSKFPTLWAISKDGEYSGKFGSSVKMRED